MADRLSPVDHELLGHLLVHRVMTTPQLITLLGRPERTVDYRLSRLRSNGVVDRTRPYAASGSAPYFWWLTRKGAQLIEGTSPAPGKATPNPLFLRHTAAIAGLYVALVDIGPRVGLAEGSWRRDEMAWEEWSSPYRGARHLRPDAHLEATLDVDGQGGRAGAFIEVDFATMDQRRLRAKVLRHADYAKDQAWARRHPGCPALLLITTSEARVTRFLANVERDRPDPSPYSDTESIGWDPTVAACACVTSPEEALSAPVWRTSVADAPSTLVSLLSGEVRTYRRLVATVAAQRAGRQHRQQVMAIVPIASDYQAIAEAIGDEEGSAAVRFVFGDVLRHNLQLREEWSEDHLDLVTATHAWWAERLATSGWPPPPTAVVDGWHRLFWSMWSEQATALLDRAANSVGDPRLRRPAAVVANGELVNNWHFQAREPIDGRGAAQEAALDYETRRETAINDTLRGLPLHRRLASSRAALASDYDARHLVACTDCGIARHDDPEYYRYGGRAKCSLCNGRLVAASEGPELPPELADSVAVLAERLRRINGGPR